MPSPSLDNILDVTLRDGGYLNDWKFSEKEIFSLLHFLHRTGIRQVEIGFLRAPERTTSSINGCPTEFLAAISQRYSDMCWVGMLNPAEDNWQEAIAGKLAYLSMIRMSCTSDLVGKALEIADYLHQRSSNVQISFNLICVSSYSHQEIADLLKQIAPSPNVDRLYFADSRGALYPDDIQPLFKLAKQYFSKPLGFHAHNTQGHAIQNSDEAFATGCDLIDVSLNSFGLAGGNTPLAGYLDHHAMTEACIETDAQAFCEQSLSLSHPAMAERQLYAVLASKNIDPVWAEKLLQEHPYKLSILVDKLPRQLYKTLDDVKAALKI